MTESPLANSATNAKQHDRTHALPGMQTSKRVFYQEDFVSVKKIAISIIKHTDSKLTTHWYLLGMHAVKTYQ